MKNIPYIYIKLITIYIMKYMGSKNRIAKYIVPIILNSFKENGCEILIDCTVGGGNFLDKIPEGIEKYGNDINEYLIEMWNAASKGWKPKEFYTKEEYIYIKNNKDVDKATTGYVGINCSYSGKWFGGYAGITKTKNGERNYIKEAYINTQKQFPKFTGVKFSCKNIIDINPTKKSLLYIDPPYKNTTKYTTNFNYEEFYSWCRLMSQKGHIVFVSEYNMPEDFICVWQKDVVSSLSANGFYGGSKKSTEKLFKLK